MTALLPEFKAFEDNFSAGKTQLVWTWIEAGADTPRDAALKLYGHDTPYSFLLESVEGGVNLGRYSVIGFAPDLKWKCAHGKVAIQHLDKNWEEDKRPAKDSLRQTIQECRITAVPEGLPPMAVSGLFGYLGYDMVRLAENIPNKNPDELGIPESILIRPTILVIFDNVTNKICVVTPVYQVSGNAKDIYTAATARIEQALEKLQGTGKPEARKTKLAAPLNISSNMQPEEYEAIVRQSVEYVRAGEIFQVVPSQRFSVDFDLPAFDLYQALLKLNPSPFMFCVNMDGFSIVGSSPEILVRVRDNTVTIRPIAGTRKRGKDEAEDKALAADLLADPKECAEHLMLLDLGRNDVGRVTEIGSVNVTDKFIIERYSHVMHIVSNVEGKLKKGLDIVDALLAGFPAGTVSGAPKVRAMEIIDELEPTRRGIYGGAIGYFSGHGEMDTCIALRTALVKDGKMYIQAGAGVVADSNPSSEEEETRNKARALIRAAEDAVQKAQA